MMRQFMTIVLLIAAPSVWAGSSATPEICAVRPDLCGKQVRRRPVARVQKALCRPYDQPIDSNNFDLPECKSTRRPASEVQTSGMNFQDYMKFNANDPALHQRIPDEETAFTDAPATVSYESTQDATLNAPGVNGGANPASFDPTSGGSRGPASGMGFGGGNPASFDSARAGSQWGQGFNRPGGGSAAANGAGGGAGGAAGSSGNLNSSPVDTLGSGGGSSSLTAPGGGSTDASH